MAKAKIITVEGIKKEIEVQFNPNNISYHIGTNKPEKKGTDDPNADASKATDSSQLTVKLFFHTYNSESNYEDVRLKVGELVSLVRFANNDVKEKPKVQFVWGTIAFEGFIDSISVTYQMFAADGTPVQAEVDMTIEGQDLDRSANYSKTVSEIKDFANQLSDATNSVLSVVDEAEELMQLPISWLFL